jgi:hypothetical protein
VRLRFVSKNSTRIVGVRPAVVALFLCPRNEAERYRAGAEAFIDRLFFQEEIDECLAYLRDVTSTPVRPPVGRGKRRT